MKWLAKWMVDPGDGIVSQIEFEHDSDDICEVSADVMNGDSALGKFYEYWLFHLEALPS